VNVDRKCFPTALQATYSTENKWDATNCGGDTGSLDAGIRERPLTRCWNKRKATNRMLG
jgi:hypothetical protein